MTENKRFTSWGNRIKRNGTLLNIEFKTKLDAKLCCKLLNQMDKDQKEYIDKLDEIFKWHKEHYGKSILDERLEFKSDCEKENEQLKAQLKKGENVCDICKYQYLTKRDTDEYYIAKCKKEHIECSKGNVNYCEDFECKDETE